MGSDGHDASRERPMRGPEAKVQDREGRSRSVARARASLRQLPRDSRGTTLIEFALIAPLLFMLLMGIVETGLMFAADILLQDATHTAARTGRTGFVDTDSTRADTIRKIVQERAGVLMDASKISVSSKSYSGFGTLKKPEPFIDANGNGKRDDGENYTDINGNGKYDEDRGATGYGGSSQVVIYTVTYPWKFFTPLIGELFSKTGAIDLTAMAVVQNEPY